MTHDRLMSAVSPRADRRGAGRPGADRYRTADEDRAAYLAQMCRLLWPAPARVSESGADREFIILPTARRPRLIVPASRRPAAAALRRYGEPGTFRARLATRGLEALLLSGAGQAVLRDRLRIEVPAGAPTIDRYLGDQLGVEISVSMHLGAARANRKPVLQLLTADGATVGFAKIGVNPLTSELVRAERDALVRLGRAALSRLRVPAVLHAGRWQDLQVLVLGPLPVWQRRVRPPPGALRRAMAEIAVVAGTERAALTESGYWRGLTGRLAAADPTPDRSRLLASLDDMGRRAGARELRFGAWHGDWTPWNMAITAAGLLVWDWERFSTGVPLGFDVLHWWLQSQVVPGQRDPRAAAAGCITGAPRLLAPLDIPAAESRLTALAYLAEIATRYLADRQAAAGARLGAAGQWLIPALAAGVAEL
jgi:hypothetical protein